MSELANRVVLSPSRMTRRAQALEKLGYVERSSDPDDGRAVRAHITEDGIAVMRSVALAHHEIVRGMYLGLLSECDGDPVWKAQLTVENGSQRSPKPTAWPGLPVGSAWFRPVVRNP